MESGMQRVSSNHHVDDTCRESSAVVRSILRNRLGRRVSKQCSDGGFDFSFNDSVRGDFHISCSETVSHRVAKLILSVPRWTKNPSDSEQWGLIEVVRTDFKASEFLTELAGAETSHGIAAVHIHTLFKSHEEALITGFLMILAGLYYTYAK
ncbi:MAG: hypothetical protein WA021_01985 [Minisyncoccia bacterium]